MDDVAIKVDHVSKVFKLPHEKRNSLKSLFINLFRGRRTFERQVALDNVSFEINKGDFFGIVGRNGSGKSTLLKLIAGIYSPNHGAIAVSGKLTPFIELGVGFNPELTGRDNVYLNCALLGFSRKEVNLMYDDIVEFAELEKFMDQKLKNYSSGMQVRLAFSISIRAKSDILVLDEVLAVGDILFQQKCFDYFHKLKKDKQTVLLVSHSADILKLYCTKGVLIEEGKLVKAGNINSVVDEYNKLVNEREIAALSKVGQVRENTEPSRRGTGKGLVTDVKVVNSDDEPTEIFTDKDDEITIKVEYTAALNLDSPVYGIAIKNASGTTLISSNSLWHELKSPDLEKSEKQEVTWNIPNIFNTGEYFISPAVTDSMGQEVYDWIDDRAHFKVRKSTKSSGTISPVHKMTLARVIKSKG